MATGEEDRIALIEAIYGAALEPARWPEVLAALSGHFDAAAASMALLDDAGEGFQFVARVGILGEPDMIERYRSYYGRFDPWPADIARQGIGSVSTTSTLYDLDDQRASPFANEYFLPAGLIDSMGSALLRDSQRSALVAIQRSRARGTFSERDRERFGAVVPHLQAALRVHRQFVGMGPGGLAQLALDRLAVGVLAIDRAGRVIHANKAAHAMLARGDGVSLDKDQALIVQDRAARDCLARLLAEVVRPAPGPGGVLRAARARGAQGYAMLVAPLRSEVAPGEMAWPSRGALILIQDNAIALKSTPANLCSLYGLTISQAKLLHALLEGKSLQDYAQGAGVRQTTVRFHLRVVFAKTGTANQSQLMRKVVQDLASFMVND